MTRTKLQRSLAAVAILAVAAILVSGCGRYGGPRRGPAPAKVQAEQPTAPAETPR